MCVYLYNEYVYAYVYNEYVYVSVYVNTCSVGVLKMLATSRYEGANF